MPTIQKEQVIDVFVVAEGPVVQEAAGGAKSGQSTPGRSKAGSGPKITGQRQAVKQPGPERAEPETPAREAMVEQSTTALPPESGPAAVSTGEISMMSDVSASAGSGSTQGSGRGLPGPLSSGGPALQGTGQGDEMEFGQGTGPGFLHREMPTYPTFARKMGKEGRVLLRLTIDEKGKLLSAEVMEDAGYGFADAALEAVRQSRFRPAIRDGKAVKSRALLPVRFVLRRP
jgi:protein TonB